MPLSNTKLIYHLDDDIEIHPPLAAICSKQLKLTYKAFTKIEDFLLAIKTKTPDLCIVDLNLAESLGAGFAVIQAIRKKFGGTMPIMVISRRSSAKDVSIALEVGASDFLPKPIDFSLFTEKMIYLLEGAEQNAFPFRKIVKPIPGKLEFHLQPILIDEVYIHLKSKFYVLRSTSLTLKHPLIKKIFDQDKVELEVHDCRPMEDGEAYSLRMIAKNPNEEYFDRLHRFLLTVV